ncbi:OmpA family protein [Thiohalobacter sp. IOR34]|uniref:OmpA family protein n=1 Tax=Thiohalobacter sp. IOR34 TaxID=3057176 RepID=UPI0025AFFFAD|nr:OmpA family protein [Thiohalobacter sp. IOR34]WJW76682.1 OmpA family protein [Thiohalobacter sp. IOR34]
MNKNLTTLSTAALLAMLTGLPLAAGAASERTCGYAYDTAGNVVRDSAGRCVRSGFWTPAKAIEECEPEMFKKEEPVTEPEPVATPAPAPAPKPVFKMVTLSAGALFDVDSDVIKPQAYAELDALVAHVKSLDSIERIEIAGHTDSSGSAEYNKQLSMRRANAVKNYLIDKGLDPRIMTTIGWGEEKPVASNATAEGRARNRRVEITLRGAEQVNK